MILIIKLLTSGWGPALQFPFKILKKKKTLGEKSCKKEQTWKKNARNKDGRLIYELACIQLCITDHMHLSP